ncbi:SDR family oxidoreductase [Salinicoccus roseus]|uniref:SDR family NAD(P)-dependent oxidoreductase n=1 Tax=Salinicoccus roseus TaxID=45670 RepID=UPI001CA649ED|nr:SDR family oxidoreductase [Salinicoccus roseus]MBY8908249.1 SDR family oxidoreductase [Salinicoccus roseus]
MGKVIITGAANGIGRGITEKFLLNGHEVLMIDYDKKKLDASLNELSSISSSIKNLCGDLKSKSFRSEIIEYVKKDFAEVNILINCAGVFPSKSALEISEEEWDDVFDLNLKSVFFLSREIARIMIYSKIENANIINITSAASEVARPGVSHYCSSKAGLKMLTQVLSLEFARFNIRVNAVGPGLVETETLQRTLNNEDKIKEHREKISYSPLGRTAEIEEVAAGVYFISSTEASYITGQNLLIDGGYSAGRVFKTTNI